MLLFCSNSTSEIQLAQWAFRQSAKKATLKEGKMKALLAPQTAMRHHSQRGPETAQGGREKEGGRASGFRGKDRKKRARTEFFYLEDGGLKITLRS